MAGIWQGGGAWQEYGRGLEHGRNMAGGWSMACGMAGGLSMVSYGAEAGMTYGPELNLLLPSSYWAE